VGDTRSSSGRAAQRLRRLGVATGVLLAAAALLRTSPVRSQEALPSREVATPAGPVGARDGGASATPVPSPSPRPITDAVDRVVMEVDEARREACREAEAKDLPCFPVSVEAQDDRRGHVNRALERLRKENADVGKGPMGPDPLALPLPTPPPAVSLATFDPVCAVKALIKGATGRNQHYYLYRVKGINGESIALRETPLMPAGEQTRAPLEFLLLGEYDGECEAVAAHAKALRELLAEKQAREAGGNARPTAAQTPTPIPLMPVD
jgi:hypothetical protein